MGYGVKVLASYASPIAHIDLKLFGVKAPFGLRSTQTEDRPTPD